MNQFRILPPKELKAKAVAKVRAFKLEEKRKALEAKRNPAVEKPAEKVVAVVEKLSPEEKKELNKLFLFNAEEGNKDEVKRLLKAEADVNAKSNTGRTALMHAAVYGYDEVAQLLIDTGADVNAKDNAGRTALIQAALNGHGEIAQMLIDAGANVNAEDDTGDTALDKTMRYGRNKIAAFLKSKGAKLGSELP